MFMGVCVHGAVLQYMLKFMSIIVILHVKIFVDFLEGIVGNGYPFCVKLYSLRPL